MIPALPRDQMKGLDFWLKEEIPPKLLPHFNEDARMPRTWRGRSGKTSARCIFCDISTPKIPILTIFTQPLSSDPKRPLSELRAYIPKRNAKYPYFYKSHAQESPQKTGGVAHLVQCLPRKLMSTEALLIL